MIGHAEAMEALKEVPAAREPMYGKVDATLEPYGQDVDEGLVALHRLLIANVSRF